MDEKKRKEKDQDRQYVSDAMVADYNVPAGEQITTNLVREMVEDVECNEPEKPAEKE